MFPLPPFLKLKLDIMLDSADLYANKVKCAGNLLKILQNT